MTHSFVSYLLLVIGLLGRQDLGVASFSSLSTAASSCIQFNSVSSLFASVKTEEEEGTATTKTGKGLFKRDRYIVTNRFSVRQDQQAKVEKRWATRKSRLAELEGFQYFHLMRRVTLNDDGTSATYFGGTTDEEAFENYVSFTIWNKKSHFSAWRSGEAFKEAHGGTSIGAFLSAMLNSARVLRGAPRPAFYDGLFLEKTTPTSIPETTDGWRTVEADGINTLNPECFVSMQKFYIPSDDTALAFEEYWSSQKEKSNAALEATPGFVARSVMRRDGQAKGHGMGPTQAGEPTYVIATIFQDLAAYQAWATKDAAKKDMPEQFSAIQSPETVFYEGTLVISSPQGA